MLRARSRQACALLQDGRILVVGGRDNAGNAVDSAEIYDPVENVWRESENLPLARWGQSATVLGNGLVLIAGGEDAERVTEALELFNPYTNAFEVLNAKLTAPRRDHGAALLPDGSVLFTGGFDGAAGLSSTDRFDVPSRAIQPGPEMSGGPRYAHSAVSLVDGSVFVAGGTDGSAETASSLLFRNGAWTEGPPLREARSRHAALRIPNNGAVLIAGGVSAGTPLATTELYGADGVLVPAGPLTVARTGLHIAAREDGVVLAAGGLREGSPIAGCGNFVAPTLVLNRARYVRNQTMIVTGQNWPANRALTVSGFDTVGSLTRSTDAVGAFSFSFEVLRPISTSSYTVTARVDASDPANAFSASTPYRVIARTATVLTMSPGAGATYGNTVTANVEVRPEAVNGQMAGVVLLNRLIQVSPPPQPLTPFFLFPIASAAPQPGTFARNVNEFGFFTHPLIPPAGSYTFQAVYQENDFYAGSVSAPVSNYPVGKAPVTLSMAISPDPPVAGTSSVVTVTASSPSLNSGNAAFRPQGFVNFGARYANGVSAVGFGTSLDAGNPPRALGNPLLRAGQQNTITANYQESANHLAASASIVRTPLKATPVLTVTPLVDIGTGVAIPMDPSPCRIWIPCRIRIAAQANELLTGTVTMQPPASVTGASLTGAVFTVVDFVVQASPSPGVRQFGFNYSGDDNFNPASTIAQVDFVKIPTVLTIKAVGVTLPAQGSVTIARNTSVTFDIEMTGATAAPPPAGQLTFSDFMGTASASFRAVSGSPNLYRVSFTRVYSTTGPVTLTFRYANDPAFLDRTETRTVQVQ